MSFRNGFKDQNKSLWVKNGCLQVMKLMGKERLVFFSRSLIILFFKLYTHIEATFHLDVSCEFVVGCIITRGALGLAWPGREDGGCDGKGVCETPSPGVPTLSPTEPSVSPQGLLPPRTPTLIVVTLGGFEIPLQSQDEMGPKASSRIHKTSWKDVLTYPSPRAGQ